MVADKSAIRGRRVKTSRRGRMMVGAVWIAPCVTWLLLGLFSGWRLPGRSFLLITRLCPTIISAIIFSSIGSPPMPLFFPSFSKHFFTVKIFHHAIIDETGMYWPVGVEHDGLRRKREGEDAGKEGAGDTDLRPEL